MTQLVEKSTQLSTDINVITAEINAYQRVAGEAIFEIGKRLKYVKDNDLAHGEFGKWHEKEFGFDRRLASKFMQIADGIDESNVLTLRHLGMSALYEIATMPEPARTETHTLADGSTKTPDEMTVRELREVKAALKAEQARREQAEAQAKTAQRSEEITRRQLDELTDVEPEVVVKTEYVEVVREDLTAVERLAQYEERFGAIENYSTGETSTNLASVTTAVMTFSREVRELIKRHAFLIKYRDSLEALDPVTKREYDEAVNALRELSSDFQATGTKPVILEAKYN